MKPDTMPKVVLVLGLAALLTAASLYLVHLGAIPAAALATPVLTILGWLAGYLKGKNELPDFLTDPVKLQAARSIIPPAEPRPPAKSLHDLAAEADRGPQ